MFLGLFLLVMLNVPIAVSLGVVAAVAMFATTGPDILPNLALVMYRRCHQVSAAGHSAVHPGRRDHEFVRHFPPPDRLCLGPDGVREGRPGDGQYRTSLFFAEISGSAVADVAALGSILIPAMKKKGYPGALAAAVTSSSATLAVIIPPSIPMILYAVMADARWSSFSSPASCPACWAAS